MKQTAVEWLESQIIKFHNWKRNPIYDENCFDEIELDKSINQAKEMEKQQQDKNKYSEEDMNDYADFCSNIALTKQTGFPFPTPKEWFEQIKKK